MADDVLEQITVFERKIGASGTILEERQVTVKAKKLKDAEKVFDKKWKLLDVTR